MTDDDLDHRGVKPGEEEAAGALEETFPQLHDRDVRQLLALAETLNQARGGA